MDDKLESFSFQVTINSIEDRVLFDALQPLTGRRRAGMARSLMRQGLRGSSSAPAGVVSAGTTDEPTWRSGQPESAPGSASAPMEDFSLEFDVQALRRNLLESKLGQ